MLALACKIAGVSEGLNGVSEIKIQKSPKRLPQQSVRFQIVMELKIPEVPKSTCHQALRLEFVLAIELLDQSPSVLPSTARFALVPGYVLLSLAVFLRDVLR